MAKISKRRRKQEKGVRSKKKVRRLHLAQILTMNTTTTLVNRMFLFLMRKKGKNSDHLFSIEFGEL
jgi:hypothetical protein